jgi:hypothetical protein
MTNGIAIVAPFSEYAAPGALANLRPTSEVVDLYGVFLSYAGFVGLMAEDSYKNPIANQKVAFEIGDPTVGGIRRIYKGWVARSCYRPNTNWKILI